MGKVTAKRVTPEEARVIAEQEREEARECRVSARVAAEIFDKGRGNSERAIATLALAFPSLGDKPGVNPWNADVIRADTA